MLMKLTMLAAAGALGTLARYALAGLLQRGAAGSFPWGTVTVNLTGCFLAGLIWALFEHRWSLSADTRWLLLVGFMGAFTTFSSLILETSEMLQANQWLPALSNLMTQNVLGFAALFAGWFLGRSV